MTGSILKKVKKFFGIGEPPHPGQILYEKMQRSGCIKCGSTVFIEGPSGGLSTNIACGECGKRYNVTPMLGIIEEL